VVDEIESVKNVNRCGHCDVPLEDVLINKAVVV
jgi:hypothetical protein